MALLPQSKLQSGFFGPGIERCRQHPAYCVVFATVPFLAAFQYGVPSTRDLVAAVVSGFVVIGIILISVYFLRRHKAPEMPYVPDLNLMNAISKAVSLFRSTPPRKDEEIIEALVAEGVGRLVASRIVGFVPIAYGRLILSKFGARFPDTFHRRQREGVALQLSLSAEPVWKAALAFIRGEIEHGVSEHDVLVVGSRSAEFNAAQQALKEGKTLEGVTWLLYTPVEEPDIG